MNFLLNTTIYKSYLLTLMHFVVRYIECVFKVDMKRKKSSFQIHVKDFKA